MKVISFLPTAELFGESNQYAVADVLKKTFQKRYTFQLLIWVLLHKLRAAIDHFLADPENQKIANLAGRRAEKDEVKTVAGCTFDADRINTASYNYDECADATLLGIYEAQATLKKLEREREKWLRESDRGSSIVNFTIDLNIAETDKFTLETKPARREFKGCRVMMPDAQPEF